MPLFEYDWNEFPESYQSKCWHWNEIVWHNIWNDLDSTKRIQMQFSINSLFCFNETIQYRCIRISQCMHFCMNIIKFCLVNEKVEREKICMSHTWYDKTFVLQQKKKKWHISHVICEWMCAPSFIFKSKQNCPPINVSLIEYTLVHIKIQFGWSIEKCVRKKEF